MVERIAKPWSEEAQNHTKWKQMEGTFVQRFDPRRGAAANNPPLKNWPPIRAGSEENAPADLEERMMVDPRKVEEADPVYRASAKNINKVGVKSNTVNKQNRRSPHTKVNHNYASPKTR